MEWVNKMSIFSDIPLRANGDDILAAWFNTLRSALITVFGGGIIGETPFTIADNQSSFQDITDLIIDKSLYRHARIEYTIYRTDAALERKESGILTLTYAVLADAWELNRESVRDDTLNMGARSLEVVAGTGQVQYKSDSMGGTYSATMTWKIISTFNKEV